MAYHHCPESFAINAGARRAIGATQYQRRCICSVLAANIPLRFEHVVCVSFFFCAQVNIEDAELLNSWQRRREEYRQRKRLTAHREKDTLAQLEAFKRRLREKNDDDGGEGAAASKDGEEAAKAGTSGRDTQEVRRRIFLTWNVTKIVVTGTLGWQRSTRASRLGTAR